MPADDGEQPMALIFVVEDHELMAQSVAMALGAEGYEVAVAEDLHRDAVLTTAERLSPAVVLLDLDLGFKDFSGVDLVEPLQQLGAWVVIVTGQPDRIPLAEAVEAGAHAVLSKSEPFDHLLDTVREAAALRAAVPPAQRDELLGELRRQRAEQAQRDRLFGGLTQREQEVLAELMAGRGAEEIAGESGVAVSTVRTQIKAVLQKLGVQSQLTAVALARDLGWHPPES